MRSPPPEEEGASEMCEELTTAPTPLQQCRGQGRELGSEDEPEKKGRVKGRYFKIQFCVLLSCSDLDLDFSFLSSFFLPFNSGTICKVSDGINQECKSKSQREIKDALALLYY